MTPKIARPKMLDLGIDPWAYLWFVAIELSTDRAEMPGIYAFVAVCAGLRHRCVRAM